MFEAEGKNKVYGFSVTDKEVVEEYLYYYPNGRLTVDVDEQMTLRDRTSANKLYLSVASNWNYKKVVPVFGWFATCKILTKNSVAGAYGVDAERLRDDEYRSVMEAMLRVADYRIFERL